MRLVGQPGANSFWNELNIGGPNHPLWGGREQINWFWGQL
jgi:hypothetical protein